MSTTELVPPSSPELEKTIIGTILTESSLVGSLKGKLPPEAFSNQDTREIYKAILALDEKSMAVDIVTVSEAVKAEPQLESALYEISEQVAAPSNIDSYVQVVLEQYIRRRMIKTAQEMQQKACGEVSIEKILSELEVFESSIADVCDVAQVSRKRKGSVVTIKSISDRVLNYKQRGFSNIGVRPACVKLDQNWEKLSDLYRPAKGMLNVITGIPGHGKSEFTDALMLNIAMEHGWKWAVFTPENHPFELYVQKLAEKLLGRGMFSNMTDKELDRAVEWLSDRFYLLDPEEDHITIQGIKQLSLEAIEKYRVDGVLWDPWNEMDLDVRNYERETDAIGRNLAMLRRFARRHDVYFGIVAHPAKIQKDQKTKKYPVPTLYDISGSAHWYNKADNGVTIYRNFKENTVDIHVQKIKYKVHGKVGTVTMVYQYDTGRFIEFNAPEESDQDGAEQQSFKW
ncbi:MAG: DnaB-like helicase N-terminal domain-containing protein [Fibrobacterota bacterium]